MLPLPLKTATMDIKNLQLHAIMLLYRSNYQKEHIGIVLVQLVIAIVALILSQDCVETVVMAIMVLLLLERQNLTFWVILMMYYMDIIYVNS